MTKFLGGKREIFDDIKYTPGPGWYSGPSDPKFNDFYKMSFLQNRSSNQPLVENPSTFGRVEYTYENLKIYK